MFVKMEGGREGGKMDDEGTGRVKGVKEVENGWMGEWEAGGEMGSALESREETKVKGASSLWVPSHI